MRENTRNENLENNIQSQEFQSNNTSNIEIKTKDNFIRNAILTTTALQIVAIMATIKYFQGTGISDPELSLTVFISIIFILFLGWICCAIICLLRTIFKNQKKYRIDLENYPKGNNQGEKVINKNIIFFTVTIFIVSILKIRSYLSMTRVYNVIEFCNMSSFLNFSFISLIILLSISGVVEYELLKKRKNGEIYPKYVYILNIINIVILLLIILFNLFVRLI